MELIDLDWENQPVLRAIATGSHDNLTALAEACDRDKSNLSKTLRKLEDAGRIAPATPGDRKPILTDVGREVVAAFDRAAGKGGGPAGFVTLEHRQIDPDPDQPRKDFGEKVEEGETDPIDELAGSIVLDGLLENLVVRPNPNSVTGDGLPRFILIAGERRWRAIRRAQERELLPFNWPIPCNVRDVDAATVRRLALIENLQRKDLKPLEEARALQAYIDETGESTADISAKLNRTQRFVQRRLQLLELSAEKMKALEADKLTLEEAWRWLANRPTAPTLSPRQWLIALEAFDRARAEDPEETYSSDVLVQAEAAEDPDLPALHAGALYMLLGPETEYREGTETGRRKVRMILHYAQPPLALRFGEAVLTDRAARSKALDALRRVAIGDEAYDALNGLYAIPWLNGPFKERPGLAKEIAAKKADQARRQEELAAANRAAGLRLSAAAAKVDALQAMQQAASDHRPQASAFVEVAAELGEDLPWRMKLDGEVVTATGRRAIHSNYMAGHAPLALLARHRLIVVAVNAAAGLATPEETDEAPEAAADPRETFESAIADELLELDDDEDATAEDGVGSARVAALGRASRGLDAYLAEEGIEFGASGYDWTIDGAADLARGIVEDGLGQPAAHAGGDAAAYVDRPDFQPPAEADEELSPAVLAMATGKAKPIRGDDEVQP